MKEVFIIENSFIAKLGAKKLGVEVVALTIGNKIYLHNATKSDLINSPIWLSHELVHVQQYEQLGIPIFLIQYLYEWIIKGYYNNKFEVEAREKEKDLSILNQYEIA